MESEPPTQERIATEYTIQNGDGSPRLRTDSPNVAEAHSQIGLRVTAQTEAGR